MTTWVRPWDDEDARWHVSRSMAPLPHRLILCLTDFGRPVERWLVRDDEPPRDDQCADCTAALCRSDRHITAHILLGNCPVCRTASYAGKAPYWHLPDGVDLTAIEGQLDESVGV